MRSWAVGEGDLPTTMIYADPCPYIYDEVYHYGCARVKNLLMQCYSNHEIYNAINFEIQASRAYLYGDLCRHRHMSASAVERVGFARAARLTCRVTK